jgi:hypothetical protein
MATARLAGLLAFFSIAALALPVGTSLAAQPPVGLGTADSYAVLAGSTVTNTGPSILEGDLGLSPGTSVTGFPPGSANGAVHVADAAAAQAQSDLTIAYDDAAGRIPPATVTGDLGGRTLTGGVYRSGSSLGLTGPLTLDAQGNPNTVFIFQAGSTLTTASGSTVNLINGAQACNVFWQIGSSATLGTSSVFVGNILALQSISLNDGVVVQGRLLARNGAVTLINDAISASHCAPGTVGGGGTGAGGTGAGGSKIGTAAFAKVPPIPGSGGCVHGTFRAVITGRSIRRVVFTLGGHKLTTRTRAPFAALIKSGRGIHRVVARITFSDGSDPTTRTMQFRSCASAARRVQNPASRTPHRPPGLTG